MSKTKTEIETAFDKDTKLGVANTAILIYSQLLFNLGIPMEQVTKMQEAVLETTVKVLVGEVDIVTATAPTMH